MTLHSPKIKKNNTMIDCMMKYNSKIRPFCNRGEEIQDGIAIW